MRQSTLLIEQPLHRRYRQAARLEEVQDRAWIEAAAARPHEQSVERTEAHRGVDAATMTHGAQTGAVAQVRQDHASISQCRDEIAQLAGQVFIRQSMETVAAHAGAGIGMWQPQAGGDRWHVTMKGGIETCDLLQFGTQALDGFHRGEMVRLMQWRQRYELLQCRQRVRIDTHGLPERGAAMHDAMSHGGKLCMAQMRGHPCKQRPQQFLVRCRRGCTPCLPVHDGAVGCSGDKVRVFADSFDDAARDQMLRGQSVLVERELDARRAGIERKDGPVHGCLGVRVLSDSFAHE